MDRQATADAFLRLLDVLNDLRTQCPWDKEQTMESLRFLTIEETYELSDSILKKDYKEVKKELGDIMLHLVFYARIAQEQGLFDIAEVLNTQCEKLISRHPHIYGDPEKSGELLKVEGTEQVKQNWEKLKMKEGNKSVLSGVPVSLPSMVKAFRMQDKVAQVGFDWDNIEQVWDKVEEEMQEFKDAKTKEESEAEFGDLIFALINYARFKGINPDDALEKTNLKFKRRFEYIEAKAIEIKKELSEMTLAEMDAIWNEAKKSE